MILYTVITNTTEEHNAYFISHITKGIIRNSLKLDKSHYWLTDHHENWYYIYILCIFKLLLYAIVGTEVTLLIT